MKVYVVTSGEYSDYRIIAVFTDLEKASYYCAVRNARDQEIDEYSCRIEEYETAEDSVEISGARKVNYLYSDEVKFAPTFDPPETTYENYHNFADFYRIVSPRPLSRTKLEKIVADLRTKYLAEKEGLI